MSALHDPSVWLNAPGRVWMSQPLSRSEHTELVMNLVKLETWWDAKFKYSICSPIPDCSSENKRVIKTHHMLFIHERAISTIIPRWSCPWTSRIRVSDNELELVDGPHHLLSSRWLSSANPNIIHPSIHPSLPHTWPGSEVLYVETSITTGHILQRRSQLCLHYSWGPKSAVFLDYQEGSIPWYTT